MRERQLRHLVSGGTLNAKYSRGGLIDIEYMVQGLQMEHGHAISSLRVTGTQEAMLALRDARILNASDYERLRAAYRLLRQLIDALRMVRGNAQDLTVPERGTDDFRFLARRLGYEDADERLGMDLEQHLGFVRELGDRLLPQGNGNGAA